MLIIVTSCSNKDKDPHNPHEELSTSFGGMITPTSMKKALPGNKRCAFCGGLMVSRFVTIEENSVSTGHTHHQCDETYDDDFDDFGLDDDEEIPTQEELEKMFGLNDGPVDNNIDRMMKDIADGELSADDNEALNEATRQVAGASGMFKGEMTHYNAPATAATGVPQNNPYHPSNARGLGSVTIQEEGEETVTIQEEGVEPAEASQEPAEAQATEEAENVVEAAAEAQESGEI